MQRHLVIGQPVQNACNRARTSTCSASERLARTTFPHAHANLVPVEHLHELRVHALGESRVELERLAHFLHGKALNIIDEHDGMGIAHRHAGHLEPPAGDINRLGHDRRSLRDNRYERRIELGGTHIDRDLCHLPILDGKRQMFHARKRVHVDLPLVGQTVVEHVLSHAANAVAAHLRTRAIGVEHLHEEIRLHRRAYEDEPIRSDAEMAVAHQARKR